MNAPRHLGPSAPLVLSGALITDGAEAPRRATLVVRDGRIASVTADAPKLDEPARAIDLAGHLLTPGLTDAHTHLLSTGEGDLAGYEQELLRASLPMRTLRGAVHARQMLDRGFTTVRDVCTEGAAFADVALRDAVMAGLIPGPRIVPSGPGIAITGGYLPMGLAPGVCVPMGAAICDGEDAARLEVRRQVSHGSAWIKVFADWPCSNPLGAGAEIRQTFSTPELEAIVDEAARRGRRVAAHATSDAGARHAVACGVASIEHMGPLSRETLDLAAARGVFLVPTLTVTEHAWKTASGVAADHGKRRFDAAADAFGRALAAGVRVASGSDVGAFPQSHEPVREIALMTELGMSSLAALAAATGEAAALLGLDDVGVLRAGAIADLCAYPMGDDDDVIDAVTRARPALVVQGGRVVRSLLGARTSRVDPE